VGGAPQARGEILRLRRGGRASRGPLNADVRRHEMTPIPPLLFIRPKHAFWTESQWNASPSATLQAFREGCFEETRCLDAEGRGWPIVAATLTTPASLLDKLFPWRRLPVALTLGQPTPADLNESIEALCEILSHPDSDFPFELSAPPTTIQEQFKSARSVPELISMANACSLGAV
jgi:hypothetical protein